MKPHNLVLYFGVILVLTTPGEKYDASRQEMMDALKVDADPNKLWMMCKKVLHQYPLKSLLDGPLSESKEGLTGYDMELVQTVT